MVYLLPCVVVEALGEGSGWVKEACGRRHMALGMITPKNVVCWPLLILLIVCLFATCFEVGLRPCRFWKLRAFLVVSQALTRNQRGPHF